MTHMPNFICPIDNHSLLLVRGADARKFLQGQVTCDIDTLTLQTTDTYTTMTSVLGAHCTHKGRMVFSFKAIAFDEQTIALYIPSDMMSIAVAALKKYIIFSKAELIDASDDYQLIGVEGEAAIATLQNSFGALATEDNLATANANGIALRLDHDRYELWLTSEQAEKLLSQLSAYPNVNNRYWDMMTINAGVVEVKPATTEMFTPHATNLHVTNNGVSFKKGCYTGQEVVARMHYLGKLKRQTFLFELALPESTNDLPAIGDPLFSPDKSQSIGNIASITQHDQQTRLLASVAVEQAEQDTIFTDAQYQQKLRPLTLPYAIPKE